MTDQERTDMYDPSSYAVPSNPFPVYRWMRNASDELIHVLFGPLLDRAVPLTTD